jgi:hypothetical protein
MRTDSQTDRRTFMTKLIVAFRNLTKAPKNGTRVEKECRISVLYICRAWGKTTCILGVSGLRNSSEGHTKIVIKSAHNSDIDSLSEVEKNSFSEEKVIQRKKNRWILGRTNR